MGALSEIVGEVLGKSWPRDLIQSRETAFQEMAVAAGGRLLQLSPLLRRARPAPQRHTNPDRRRRSGIQRLAK